MAGILLALIVGVLIIAAAAGAMWLFVTVAKAWQQNAQDVLGASRPSRNRRQHFTRAADDASSEADQTTPQDDG